MGDGGPCVNFNPQKRDFWASHTGLAALHDNQLDQAYQRAYSFILYAKERLILEHSWEMIAVEDSKLLFDLMSAEEPVVFCLPKALTSFLDPVAVEFWKLQFGFGVFHAKCPAGQDNDLCLSGPIPLSDIFYLLQSVAPGMIVIAHGDKFDDTGKRECVRALPRPEWVENHHQLLEYVLGSSDAYQALLDASRDHSKAFSCISQQEHALAVPFALRKEEEEARERSHKTEEEARAAAKAKVEEAPRLRKEAEKHKAAVTGSPIPSLAALKTASPFPADPPNLKRPIPCPLDLSATSKPGPPPALPPALATARVIDNLEKVQYPEGVMSPKPELNAGVANGKFRYDRDFLMQFYAVCKDKPDQLPSLDAISLKPTEQSGSGRNRGNSRSHVPPPSSAPGRPAPGIPGLGIINDTFGGKSEPSAISSFPMVQFGPGGNKIPSSDERFAASQIGRSASVGGPSGGGAFPPCPAPIVRTASQGGSGTPAQPSTLGPSSPTRSQCGGKRHDSNKVGNVPPVQDCERAGSSFGAHNEMSLEPVKPLEAIESHWTPISTSRRAIPLDPDSPEVVERRVKRLLKRLSMEEFDSISDQIIDWANRSEKEKDGRTLFQVIRLVLEEATEEAAWSEMYARLCRKMMEQISQNVQDDGIRNSDGKPIAGGQLFRKYLLNRCQEDFERGWTVKEASAKAAESKAADDKAARDAAHEADATGKGTGEEVLYSDEYYAAQKAKRQGLGLVKFIGELFKLQMLTERIMHECIKKLLGNVENPEEEELESLCTLLSTVGQQLDTRKGRSHMDVYFQRMKELVKSSNITSRMRYMILDVLELRERKWVTRTVQAAPTKIAAVNEQAVKDQAKAQKDQSVCPINREMSGGREYRGVYDAETGRDRRTSFVAAPPGPPTADDSTIHFGSILARKRGASLSHMNSTLNMSAMVTSDAAASGKSSHGKHSADLDHPETAFAQDLSPTSPGEPTYSDPMVGEERVPDETGKDKGGHSLTEAQAAAEFDRLRKDLLEHMSVLPPSWPTVFKSVYECVRKAKGGTVVRRD